MLARLHILYCLVFLCVFCPTGCCCCCMVPTSNVRCLLVSEYNFTFTSLYHFFFPDYGYRINFEKFSCYSVTFVFPYMYVNSAFLLNVAHCTLSAHCYFILSLHRFLVWSCSLLSIWFRSYYLTLTFLPLFRAKDFSVFLSIYLSVCLPVSLCLFGPLFTCAIVWTSASSVFPLSVAWASVAFQKGWTLFSHPGFRCGVPSGWWLPPGPQAPAHFKLWLDGRHVPWLFHGKLRWEGEFMYTGWNYL